MVKQANTTGSVHGVSLFRNPFIPVQERSHKCIITMDLHTHNGSLLSSGFCGDTLM